MVLYIVPANSQLLSTLQPGAMRCHGTRGCKRCPSTSLYELLSLSFNSLFSSLLLSWPVLDIYIYIYIYIYICVYSGFVYFSLCCVFI